MKRYRVVVEYFDGCVKFLEFDSEGGLGEVTELVVESMKNEGIISCFSKGKSLTTRNARSLDVVEI